MEQPGAFQGVAHMDNLETWSDNVQSWLAKAATMGSGVKREGYRELLRWGHQRMGWSGNNCGRRGPWHTGWTKSGKGEETPAIIVVLLPRHRDVYWNSQSSGSAAGL